MYCVAVAYYACELVIGMGCVLAVCYGFDLRALLLAVCCVWLVGWCAGDGRGKGKISRCRATRNCCEMARIQMVCTITSNRPPTHHTCAILTLAL